MKNINKYSYIFKQALALFLLLSVVGCKNDVWDEHYKETSGVSTNLLDVISKDPELSKFLEYLKATENDSLLTHPRAYTVWAPTNSVLENLDASVSGNPTALKAFIQNHISQFSYSTSNANEPIFVKMLNSKFIEFVKTGTGVTFGPVNVTEQDQLASNGILHKIDGILSVNPNIWEYLNQNKEEFPIMMEYLVQFNDTIFDEENSVVVGSNSIGQTLYDSIFIESNTHFEIIGDLNIETERFTTLGITDDAYTSLYDIIKPYYNHLRADTIANNTRRTIFKNFNFQAFEQQDLDDFITNTVENDIMFNETNIVENITLSNGNILIVDDIDFDPRDIIYKPVRYEIENSDRLEVGSLSSLPIKKIYNKTASGEFINEVKLLQNPNVTETNNYFEVSFPNVLAASYDIYIKFQPIPGDFVDTKLKFELSYKDRFGRTIVSKIPSTVIPSTQEQVLKIGDSYTFSYFVDDQPVEEDPLFFVKLKVLVDVSEIETLLYDREFRIDYVELVPVPVPEPEAE